MSKTIKPRRKKNIPHVEELLEVLRHDDNLVVDGIQLGWGNRLPIFKSDVKVMDGDLPTVCPKAHPQIPSELLTQIQQRWRSLGWCPIGKTIHWVGRQDTIERLCTCQNPSKRNNERGVSNLRIEGRNVYVDNQQVALDMTPERLDDALAFLGVLLSEPGNWFSSSDIGRQTKKEGTRFDRVKKSLPLPIQNHIQTNRRKGYRIRL